MHPWQAGYAIAGRNDSRLCALIGRCLRLQAGTRAISRFVFAQAQGKIGRGKPEPIMQTTAAEPFWDRNELRRALEAADPATLMLSLVQLTGERHWLDAARPHIRGPMNYQEFMPEELGSLIRDRLSEAMITHRRAG